MMHIAAFLFSPALIFNVAASQRTISSQLAAPPLNCQAWRGGQRKCVKRARLMLARK